MTRFHPFIAIALLLLTGSLLLADQVVLQDGEELDKKKSFTGGSVVLVSSEKVIFDRSGMKTEIPANIIAYVSYEGEPAVLQEARAAYQENRLNDTVDALEKAAPDSLKKDWMKQDYYFLQAAVKAQNALAGAEKPDDALKLLLAFTNNHKESFHYYEVYELYGDLAAVKGDFKAAKNAYDVLAKAPEKLGYGIKAKVSQGMNLLGEKKFTEAKALFADVIKAAGKSAREEQAKKTAIIGQALCSVGENKPAEGIKSLEELAKTSGNEDSAFQALLYNSLGAAYAKGGKQRDAVMSYLYTDVLFSSARTEHIKALKELSKLWKELKRDDRSAEADKRLKTLYNVGK
jgi:hypothetical protein